MARCEIRGMKEEDILKLGRMAKKKGISREEYLRRIIHKHLLENDIKAEMDRYEGAIKTMIDVIENNSERLEELTEVVRRLEISYREENMY